MSETLLELVNKMDNDVVFNVGTEGSGWIFIGTKTEFLKTIDSINKFYTKKYSLLLKNAISAIEGVTVLNRKRKRKKIQDKYKRSLFHDEDYDAWNKRLLEEAAKLPNRINYLIKAAKKAQIVADNFTAFETREVIEKSFTDISNTPYIKIAGRDNGEFWTKEEFNTKYRNGKRIDPKPFVIEKGEDEEEED